MWRPAASATEAGAETADSVAAAALAPENVRGSAFGLLYTVASPAVAFVYLAWRRAWCSR